MDPENETTRHEGGSSGPVRQPSGGALTGGVDAKSSIPAHALSNPESEQPERVTVYLDGFNFYHGLMAKGWGRYRWLDYAALLRRHIRDPQVLTDLKYFTAPVIHEPDKLPRQDAYLRALEVHAGVQVIKGAFHMRIVRCQLCRGQYRRPQEKLTDVNIATHLVADAYEDRFDTAYLVCADGDLVPAVAHVQKRFGKMIVLIDPPKRHSDDLAAVVDRHWHISESHLRQSQLPNPVESRNQRGKVRRIHRPETWGPGNLTSLDMAGSGANLTQGDVVNAVVTGINDAQR